MHERQFSVCVDMQNRQVAAAVKTDHVRLVLLFVPKRYCDVARSGNDVIIGHDVAIGVNNKPGTNAFLRKNLKEEIALVNDAGDINRSGAVGLVDDRYYSVRRTRIRNPAQSPGPTKERPPSVVNGCDQSAVDIPLMPVEVTKP